MKRRVSRRLMISILVSIKDSSLFSFFVFFFMGMLNADITHYTLVNFFSNKGHNELLLYNYIIDYINSYSYSVCLLYKPVQLYIKEVKTCTLSNKCYYILGSHQIASYQELMLREVDSFIKEKKRRCLSSLHSR